MIIGMDFGTTHSGMARFDGQQLQSIPLNTQDERDSVTRTVLYITNDQKVSFGREAVDGYFEQNLGRPVKMERVWVGEIELTFAEVGTFVRDVYTWVDANAPGRLFQSFKTDLPDSTYAGTTVGRFFYSLEDIVALYLSLAKQRAERFLDQELTHVVLGRPVRFSENPQDDALAQERLVDAAMRAGYSTVYFEHEPIAAAHYFETTMDRIQNVLVFDFGGGTLDVTVMRLGDPRERQVLATGGVPIAGDIFDKLVVRAKLPKHFGEGGYYGSADKELAAPTWIYDTFADWRTILTLQTPKNMAILRDIAMVARDKQSIEALMSLVTSNYSLKMFDVVEQVKRRLSARDDAVIRLGGPGFAVREPITRREFENIIRHEYRIIEQHVDETVRASGLSPDAIDVVIRTGGSSQIPLFQRMLEAKFGAGKVRAVDTFGSVTSGLGVIANGIEKGKIDKIAYTQSRRIVDESAAPTNIPPVNLDVLKEQIAQQERAETDTSAREEMGIAVLSKDYELTVAALPADFQKAAIALPTDDLELPDYLRLQTAQIMRLDEPLLLITSRFQLLLITLRELVTYQESGLEVRDVHGFERSEQICVLGRWRALANQERLVLVSSQGVARAFEMRLLRPQIEGATPTRIGWTQAGWPRLVLAGGADDALVLVNSLGRVARMPLKVIPRAGMRVLPKQKTDDIIGGACMVDGSFILVSADGYGAHVPAQAVPAAKGRNGTGHAVVRRRGSICGMTVAGLEHQAWALTSTRLVPLPTEMLLPQGGSGQGAAPGELRRMTPILTLEKDEQVTGILDVTATL